MGSMGFRPAFGVGVTFAVLVVAILLWQGDEAPPPLGGPSAATPVDQPAVATAQPELAAGPVTSRVSIDGGWWTRSLEERIPDPLATDEDNPYSCRVRGRLTVRQRPWLHPAGLEVRLTRSWLDSVLPTETARGDQRAPASDDVSAVTDADGWFVLRFAPTAGELFFLIDQRGEWSDFQKVPRVPRAGDSVDLGDIWLDDRGGITGTVTDLAGQPIANATIRAVDDPLMDLAGGLDELRAARNRGLERFRVPGNLTSGPLPDWVIRRDQFLPFATTTTDRRGRFRCNGLRPGAHDVFVANEQGYAKVSSIQVAGARITDIGRIQLGESFPIGVRFVDELRQPWVGAEVAFLHGDFGFGSPAQRTNARGEINAYVPAGQNALIAFAYPGGGPWITRPLPFDSRVVIERPPTCTVSLADERGAAISGGQVRFYVTGAAFRQVDRALPAGMQPTPIGTGQYRGRLPCAVVAVAAAPGFAPAMAPIDASATEIAITMLPIRSITVRTVDRHGTVVPHASVRIQAHRNPELTFAGSQWDLLANDRVLVGNTDDEGLLRVPAWDTFLSLQADHPAFGPSPGPKVHPIPGQVIDLALRRPARLEGRLLFHQRPAASGFRVRARQKPPIGHELEGSGWLDEQLAVTDANGTFGLRGLNAGIWELKPQLPAVPGIAGGGEPGSQWRSVQVLLDEDQELFLNLEAEADPLMIAQITGLITRDGVPIPEALVRLREAEQGMPATPREDPRRRGRRWRQREAEAAHEVPPAIWSRRFTTDSFGSFTFGDLQPDTDYELRIDVEWQGRLQFVERRVVRTPKRVTDPPLKVQVGVTSCSLQLLCTRDAVPFADRMLRLRQIGKEGEELSRYEVLTAATGIATLSGIPAGTWSIEPMHGGYCRPAEFVVKPGESASASVEILDR